MKKKISDELKNRISKTIKSKIATGEIKIVFPIKDTSIEVKIQNYLKELGVEFFTHQYIDIEHGYQCDVFIPILTQFINPIKNLYIC